MISGMEVKLSDEGDRTTIRELLEADVARRSSFDLQAHESFPLPSVLCFGARALEYGINVPLLSELLQVVFDAVCFEVELRAEASRKGLGLARLLMAQPSKRRRRRTFE